MKDVARGYGKTAGFAAAGALLLSLAVGIVSGHAFPVAFARAILFAVLFAALGAAARFIVTRYLPEAAAGKTASGEGPRGQAVDITLPEERPGPAGGDSEPFPADSGISGDASLGEAPAAAGEIRDLGLAARPERPTTEDDLDDLLPPLTDAFAAGEDEEVGEDSDLVEEAESVSDEGPAETPAAAAGKVSESEPEDLGRLPDISELAGPGTSGPPRGAGRPPAAHRPSGRVGTGLTPDDEMKGALGSQDPATLARAIRTVLKREEKG